MSKNSGISIHISDLPKIQKKLMDFATVGHRAVTSTVTDLKKRAPGWVANEVCKEYAIDKKEIKPGSIKRDSSGNKTKVKQAGSLRTSGDTVESFTITYNGRALTPIHFNMNPTSPTGADYELTMTVHKGRTETIGRYFKKRQKGGPYSRRSHNILMGTGNTKAGGTNYIPFQRMSTNRTDLEKFLTTSVPQMVGEESVYANIQSAINSGAEKRLDHYLNKYSK